MFTKRETNFCKGIGIILMLFHHLFNDYEEYVGHIISFAPLTEERIHFLASLAKICVAIFVFLSGYGIAATYRSRFADHKPGKTEIFLFTWKRLWKLMVGYWFIFLLTLLCQPFGRTIFDAYGNSIKEIVLYFLIDAGGLAYLFGTPTLNPTWWYMSMAITVILLMPLVMKLMDEFGSLITLGGTVLVLFMLKAQNANTFYLFSMVLGAVCFEQSLFGRVSRLGAGKRYAWLGKAVLESVCLLVLLAYRTNYNYYGIVDGLIAMVIAMLVNTILIRIPVVTDIMQYLGVHSANMFLAHNQIYSLYFPDFFYSFGHWAVILAVLTAVSLLVSVVTEWLKKHTGYQECLMKIGDQLVKRLELSENNELYIK